MERSLNCKRILVARGGALGDFVLTLPALAALRGRFPGARLEILGYPRIAALAEAGRLAEAVHAIEAPALATLFAPGAAERQGNEWLAEFDLMVSYIYDADGVFRGNVRRIAPEARFVAGPHRPDEQAGIHAAEVFLKPLETVGIVGANGTPRLNIGADSTAAADEKWVALHPGSGSERKNWPEENWAELLREILAKTEWHCLLVGGEAEGNRLERLEKLAGGGARLELAQNWPLPKLAARLRSCAGFAGHDSGVTHLAAAVGLAGLALWGESNERVWRPRGGGMRILRHEGGLSRLPVGDVFGNLQRIVEEG